MSWLGAIAGCGLCLLGFGVSAAPAAAQTYDYIGTIGADSGIAGLDNAHFDQPYGVAVDPVHGHLFITDSVNQRVQVFDSATEAYVATIGPGNGASGVDNGHFNLPGGVAVDTVHGHVLVPDVENNRVQIFSTATFAYVATLGADDGAAGTDNAHFHVPASVAVDEANGQILVADVGNLRIQVFSAASLTYLTSLGQTRAHFIESTSPVGLAIDAARKHIIIVDFERECIEVITTGTYESAGQLGACSGVPGQDDDSFDEPLGAGVDALNGLILVADTVNNRIQYFDATSLAFVGVIGLPFGAEGTENSALFQPSGIGFDPATGHVLIADTLNNRVQIFGAGTAGPPPQIFSAVLPGARSVEVATPATVFGTILNTSSETVEGCGPSLPSSAPAGLSLTYETTNPQNQVTGEPDAPATIAARGAQAYLLTFQSAQALTIKDLALDFSCTDEVPAAVVPGLNTVDLTFATAPGADVIALAATPTGNGIVSMPVGGDNAFAVATVNLGASDSLTVSVDFGGATLPASVTLCETEPSTGACLAAPAASFVHSFAPGDTPTFSAFVTATGTIAFNPAGSRIFVRFTDPSGGSHGSTSVAVETE
jgi:DNA-binding beta-propeller fold protein YncE